MLKSLFAALCLLGSVAEAASVSGQIHFLSRRGRKPVVTDTVIWLEPIGSKKDPVAGNFEMPTRGKTITPRVLIVPVGSRVRFPNEDPISHNLFSVSGGNSFDLGLYQRGAGKEKRFDVPGVVNVYCNVHPNMSAVVRVVPSMQYGFADAAGRFRLENVSPGRYRISGWHEQGGTAITEIVVGAADSGAVALTLDARSFRQQAHMNKEGRPYSASRSSDY